MKWLLSRIYFVVYTLPVALITERYWLKKLIIRAKHDGVYRALQSAFDYFGNPYFYRQEQLYRNYKQSLPPCSQQPLSYQPYFSLVVPVFNTKSEYLRKMFDSVLAQTYEHWELCVADGSSEPDTRAIIASYAARDKRIRVTYLKENLGISGNSNAALALANGDYIGLLDSDDELTPRALETIAQSLQSTRHDLIYTDHVIITRYGVEGQVFFKPDWSPDFFLSTNYLCHFVVFKRALLEKTGTFNSETEGSQDYDLLLKLTEHTTSIYHLPHVLYRWRQAETSMSYSIHNRPYAIESGKIALEQACARRGIRGTVTHGHLPGFYRVKRDLNGAPLVSIIMPFHNQYAMTKRCVTSILKKSTYKNLELLFINQQCRQRRVRQYIHSLAQTRDNVRVISYDQPYNYSAMNNRAVAVARGEYLLFLNNDTEVITPDWIEALLEQAQRPEIGAVGAKLLFYNNTIQHCGVVFDRSLESRHLNLGLPDTAVMDTTGRAHCINNYSAVTAAAMMMSRECFNAVGGFDEALPASYNDTDLCLKCRSHGLQNLYTPYAVLFHRGGATRPDDTEELRQSHEYVRRRWQNAFPYDPFFPYI